MKCDKRQRRPTYLKHKSEALLSYNISPTQVLQYIIYTGIYLANHVVGEVKGSVRNANHLELGENQWSYYNLLKTQGVRT
jgi:hypothetical protein